MTTPPTLAPFARYMSLRQAGADSRFGDEMHDIMERISAPTQKPSSLRRGALLELAQKVQEKDFRRQFRNHGEGGLFKQVGDRRWTSLADLLLSRFS